MYRAASLRGQLFLACLPPDLLLFPLETGWRCHSGSIGFSRGFGLALYFPKSQATLLVVMQMATARLTNLLPTAGYLLPYALSLFFASLILTFAGAFLTLDRTRSFEPASDVFQDRQKSTSRIVSSFIRGGIGGILAGFVFGGKQPMFSSISARTSLSQFISLPSFPFLYQASLHPNL